MLVNLHLLELKFRVLYLSISSFLIFLLLFNKFNILLDIFTPNYLSFFVYSNILDAFILKFNLSFYFTLLFIIPYYGYSSWAFIRPGLYKYEDIGLKTWIFVLILPVLLYLIQLKLFNVVLLDIFTGENTLNNGRLLPSLIQIVLLSKNLIVFSLLITLLFVIKLPFKNTFIKWRTFITFSLITIISFFLPPDLLLFFIVSLILIITLETFLFILILKDKFLQLSN